MRLDADRSGYDELSEMLEECEEEQARVLGLVNESAVLSQYQSNNDADEVGSLGGLGEGICRLCSCVTYLEAISSDCCYPIQADWQLKKHL